MVDESIVREYAADLEEQFESGHAGEHAYRPALKTLLANFVDTVAVNDPKKSAFGNPDFVFAKRSNKDIVLGYAEAKDINVKLDKTIKTEQLRRYAGYEKLFLTNYLEFRFLRNGERYESITIGKIEKNDIAFYPEMYRRLCDELQAFLELPPEQIRSGKRLAVIMGGKARRIRDNVQAYLQHADNEKNKELEKIFTMMKTLLVHDLTVEKFADMYAQTLVYGLFVARYNDKTPDTFTRSEARDLVPANNPFLREFFDHIVGPRFDKRLSHIVDELCEVFSVSDVHKLVQKHLRLLEQEGDKDPIIHFYEDFLKEYDPAERKRMGAYYTPVPVVRFIVREVDEILKREFGLPKGLADTSKIIKEIEVGQKVHVRNAKTGKMQYADVIQKEFHRVQVLDPAVGTATFLNEVIKHIYKGFEGQEGRWPKYAEEELLPRIHGFELMMASYTIAHLKLDMTLQETGVKDFKERLGVYLTNTLEEGVKRQQDLLSFGLAEVVSHEAEEAAKIKHERPIMIVIGNPPYSVSSSNKSKYILNLIKDYKKDLNERKLNLDDDYIKFIRFAEEMVNKNGEGVVAMITNNSYIDGLTHRQMRKHLLVTFDKIYVLDLHGNSKKKEVSPDGGKDENVFNIMQGVAIVLMVKTNKKKSNQLSEIHHAEIHGRRQEKLDFLQNAANFQQLPILAPGYYFVPKDFSLQKEYDKFIELNGLFYVRGSGVQTDRDELFVDFNSEDLSTRIQTLLSREYSEEFKRKYNVVNSSSFKLIKRIAGSKFNKQNLTRISYRPFDVRQIYYDEKLISRPGYLSNKHLLRDNLGLVIKQGFDEKAAAPGFIVDSISDRRGWSRPGMQGAETIFPLYLFHDDGTRTTNFNLKILREFTRYLTKKYESEDLLDYIYAVLHSMKYREKYKEFLKTDFPRVPIPKNDEEFERLAGFGRQLRELHLLKSSLLNDLDTTYSVSGSDVVEKVNYSDGKVWINETQYFGNVPEAAWNFYIGGYQPAQKWQKDRKGLILSNQDIEHYQKIIKALAETDKIMKQIDQAWEF
jgi:predicted helicase